jgi:predicted lipid-binding transport protein (Tim44 family)
MKPLRWLAAGLLWILAGLLGVLGVLLSVTVILLPVGIPLLLVSRRVFSLAMRLVVPRSARHPVRQAHKGVKRQRKVARKRLAPKSRRGLLERVRISRR